jgi:hypothetical protein
VSHTGCYKIRLRQRRAARKSFVLFADLQRECCGGSGGGGGGDRLELLDEGNVDDVLKIRGATGGQSFEI